MLGIVSNLDMIQSIQENVHRLYVNTSAFCIEDLSIQGFWYLKGCGANPPQIQSDIYICFSTTVIIKTRQKKRKKDRKRGREFDIFINFGCKWQSLTQTKLRKKKYILHAMEIFRDSSSFSQGFQQYIQIMPSLSFFLILHYLCWF